MQPIVFNLSDSILQDLSESTAIRSAYLIAGKLISAGNNYVAFDLDNQADMRDIYFQIKLIELFLRNDQFADMRQKAENIFHTYKLLKNKKCKLQPDIVMMKKLEKFITEQYKFFVEIQRRHLKTMGLYQLSEIFNSGEGTVVSFSNNNTNVSEERKQDLINLFQLKDSNGNLVENVVFCLHSEFFLENCKRGAAILPFETADENSDSNIVADLLFTFPDINLMSGNELKALRAQLSEAASLFVEKAGTWIQMLTKGDGHKDFFRCEVVPAANLFQNFIDNNQLLRFYRRTQKNHFANNVYMGYTTLEEIWNFYKNKKVMPLVIEEDIFNLPEECKKRPVPVMITEMQHSDEVSAFKIPDKEPQEIFAAKKSLVIE